MNTSVVITVVVVAIVGIAVITWVALRSRRRTHLRDRFGPEYQRTVSEAGSPSRAEALLEERERRVAEYHIVPLSDEVAGRYAEEWRHVQARFVDDPAAAVTEADLLIGDVMRAKGYPMRDFAARAADLSVEHASVVDHYRIAHAVAERQARGEASTEDLRQAIQHYRALFDELSEVAHPKSVRRP